MASPSVTGLFIFTVGVGYGIRLGYNLYKALRHKKRENLLNACVCFTAILWGWFLGSARTGFRQQMPPPIDEKTGQPFMLGVEYRQLFEVTPVTDLLFFIIFILGFVLLGIWQKKRGLALSDHRFAFIFGGIFLVLMAFTL